ncbi:BEACH domain-containing protein B-like isoform X1 [Macadamia integrifolia]|uniref:BEACH domain-containing protein B-like isoform X1 n=2 Tax=Macadamia integrifolia TaxID=60698 RepID=UPI001C4ED754|nr:BEACH domain-containing protein B-like isoform X1 [Macadamia integrifolia]XP_042508930.1 BEACH domain-containing protein B-like isoform X1 [Macadamia integrifolia]XP_042508931.1 BEACH domain-containing protein B-like isoform X1 [Macadamia integrifolia]
MNIVKGVADLLRRTSTGQPGESGSWSQAERFSAPCPKICFSEVGDEAILNTLWRRHEAAIDKVEKRKLFYVFLKQFLLVYKNWEPVCSSQLLEVSSTLQLEEHSSSFDDIVVGCSDGHPAEIILTLSQEVAQLTSLVTELNTNTAESIEDLSGGSFTMSIIAEGFPVLDALTIVVRSMHNCKVLGYYGGIQKLTALMKAAVVQLKTVTVALAADEGLSNPTVEKTKMLQKILIYVVSIIFSFIYLNLNAHEKAQLHASSSDFSVPTRSACLSDPSTGLKTSISETWRQWHQKAVVSVMEAGGLNWLVELLRVIRRLNMKEQWTDISLQYLTLRTLQSALFENPRGQNHFRSIGGLEVLLDGLGLPSDNALLSRNTRLAEKDRKENPFPVVFGLQLLSLEVLREVVFGNLNNLQFLCENGRVHKLANSICWPAFMLQEFRQWSMGSSLQADLHVPVLDSKEEFPVIVSSIGPLVPFDTYVSFSQYWKDYAAKLSSILCSFLMVSEDFQLHHVHTSVGRTAVAVSPVYWELSIKWIMKVLLTVLPCIKACSNQNELPGHLRVLVNTLERCVLYTFRRVLVSSPALLEVFREEGIWDLIFSENFFYFGPTSDESSGELIKDIEEVPRYSELSSTSSSSMNQVKLDDVEILQLEVISFVEFAATFNGSAHNLPECSVLLDALEQSVCQPEIANVLAKSLHRILQLATEKTVASFKTLNAIPRVLKVACVQAQEFRRSGCISPLVENEFTEGENYQSSSSIERAQSWLKCMKTSMELFTEYLSVVDDAKSLVLRDSSSIDCLFNLFWEGELRKQVLRHILDLMKLPPSFKEDQVALLHLCSKYLEMFTSVKEREQNFAELSIGLLVGMRDMLLSDKMYYQTLFRDGECFLHIVSLLNGNLDKGSGEKLVLNVLQTLTSLLAGNDTSKASFRALVGKGYRTLQSLLLDFFQWQSSEGLLSALLDMLVDGKFDIKLTTVIKNEDVVLLFLSVLQKSSDSLRSYGLNVFQQLLRDSISNRDSCVRAGMLNFLLDWFAQEENDGVILKIAQLIQVIGGHSISGKDIRKIFALLRGDKIGARQQYCSLLLISIQSMLNEKGPAAFFDLSGNESGIVIRTPVQWPHNKGFSFSCWVRVENFPRTGTMGLFSFLTENGKGCFAVFGRDKLVYESINVKRQCVSLHLSLVRKKWHFLCITHSVGRAFSGGSILRCYLDGDLVSSEKCRYPKINEALTCCSIGAKVSPAVYEEENPLFSVRECSPFLGQIGPVYMFSDAISSEQILGIYSLGPSYMYSFLDNEVALASDYPLPSGILDPKDGLASRIIFGLNAQASDGRNLFNVSPLLDHALDKNSFEAVVMAGTQLCSRRLLQQIIYCVGGVSVFFPLLTQFGKFEDSESEQTEETILRSITRNCIAAEAVELIASFLDENIANQQQMHHVSGFSILGFLLQSVPSQQLNLETLSALKHMFNVVANCGLSELLVRGAISSIFLNPLIWVHTAYNVQRELYMFLIQQFDNDPRLLTTLCRLPRVIDIIHQFYWDKPKTRSAFGSVPLLHPVSKQIIGERPSREEIHKIRLVLLSLGEMSLRQNIAASDIKALIAFFERSQDMACVEDVLHMVIRAVSQKPLLASFLEQVNILGGSHIFVNLLQRESEPIRLLSLQFLGRLLVGLPSEKKGPRFFNLGVGRSRSLSESHRKVNTRLQPIFSAIADRLFKFPQTDLLCATLFDALLGGASPKQVLQKHNQADKQRSKGNNSHFFLPEMLELIFRVLSSSNDTSTRVKILWDLLDLLDSNPCNIEALVEHGWNSWLATSAKLDVLKNYKAVSRDQSDGRANEQHLVRNLFCVVLCHYMHSVKGGWQHLEETLNFLLVQSEQGDISYRDLLRDIFEDLVGRLVELSSEDNIFVSQPCRDNTLYLLRLVDEMLIEEIGHKLPYPGSSSDIFPDSLELESQYDLNSTLSETSRGENSDRTLRNPELHKQPLLNEDDAMNDEWWNLYDKLWIIISEMNGKGPSKILTKPSSSIGPSLGQRARGLVESLNIPAAEMAAVVVSGGISNALGGKPSKSVDKAMLLRGEKVPRTVFRLVILYLCKAGLERASRCVQQVIPLLPCLLAADDEQSKNKLQLFIWSLLTVRLRYGMMDDGARFHVLSQLIRETVNCGKSMLATGIVGKDDSSDSVSKQASSIHGLIQKERVLAMIADEVKYISTSKADRNKQLHELRVRMDEISYAESNQKRAFEDEIQSSLSTILASDDSRRDAFQLAHDEDQQIVAQKWIHMFRALIDERGPWSANPFPNSTITHWKLDKAEDMWRRRPKLRRNYHFDEKLCHPPSTASSNDICRPVSESKTGFGSHIPEQMKRLILKGLHKITDEGSMEPSENDTEQNEPKAFAPEDPSDQSPELLKDGSEQKDIGQDRKDPSFSTAETETSEVLLSVPCVLVTPKRKLAGHLAVMKSVLHFFGEFLVEGTGGSSVFNSFHVSSSSDSTKPDQLGGVQNQKLSKWPLNSDVEFEKGNSIDSTDIVDETVLQKQPNHIKRHRRWNVSKIKAVYWTRYLLRHSAIEVFFNDSSAPIFFNFATTKVAKDVGTLIVSCRNESLFPKGSAKDRSGVISFVDRRVAVALAETARESWRRRDISNFEYLMILNTLAGRSYNDLTQYPVFPWVLADYSSEKLDFNKSSTFRDLSKPVGALDSKRFEVFEDRYRNFCDPDIPSFYYGSHYSSMGMVLFYLLRLEPFTTLHRNLQGGKFDHADRLFQSIEGTYRNCLSNTSDVKELIPEFFYMPEFLVNSNSYHLGVKQDGEPIADVCLPPWAKGSHEEFINKNREALESEYVSSNLHHWIDLVFGYKQRGKPAVEAANVFYYLTYEGAVDLDTMEDELQRSAIEDQIANFGQTPIQIFRKKHPRRGPPIPIAHPLYFAPGSISLTSTISSTTHPPSAVLFVGILDSNIVLVNQGLTLSIKMWLTTQLQSGGNFTFSGSQDPFFGIGSDVLVPCKIGSPLAENIELGTQCFATMQTPSENFLISCGNWENSFQVISLNDGRIVQSIRQHKDVVSCVAVTSDGSILATGSYDTTVMVWEVFRVRGTEKKVRYAQTELPRKDYIIVETPFHILCGHDDVITCLFVSAELDIVISGSKDGTCVFHTLREGRYIRSLQHPCGSALSKLVASRHGRIIFYADDDLSLHLYSINGKHIATSESNGRLNCVELSSCGEFLVCAGDQGQIVVRSMNSLEVVRRYDGVGRIITSLTVTPEECFLAGTKDGSLLVYSIENPQLRKTSIPRNVKSKASLTG